MDFKTWVQYIIEDRMGVIPTNLGVERVATFIKEDLKYVEDELLGTRPMLDGIKNIADSLQNQVDGGKNGLNVYWTIRELRKLYKPIRQKNNMESCQLKLTNKG